MSELVQEIRDILISTETSPWPADDITALITPVAEWAQTHETSLHHVGFTYPTREAFEQATAGLTVIENDLVVGGGTVHHRRYQVVHSRHGGPDMFIEHHVVGDNGNGVQGIHFDFITDMPRGMLAYVKASLEEQPDGLHKIVTQDFGGGNNPVAKVALQPTVNPGKIEVGVMARTHYTRPETW